MYDALRLSRDIYVVLCHEIGTPTDVRFRRELMDIEDMMTKPFHTKMGLEKRGFGSRGEGLRYQTSDIDVMLWPSDVKVIFDRSQICLYRSPNHSVILMECFEQPPGYCMLKLVTPSDNLTIRASSKLINGEVYISSSLHRDILLPSFLFVLSASPFQHGPCTTISMGANIETDMCLGFRSHHWPKFALSWIQRCRKQTWPSEIVTSDILSKGFHVVPIGSTQSYENEDEWRISFSQAEQMLVFSMNHCQFLCYGLFKVFLTDVINMQSDIPVLCSYFIKTIVFWVIHKNTSLIWTPDNLLYCFWQCFKLLLFQVHIGECPNFFIPQNNMFRLKVNGSVQISLFRQLYDLYCEGMSCLLSSPSLRLFFSQSILSRSLGICTEEISDILSFDKVDIRVFQELNIVNWGFIRIEDNVDLMSQVEKLLRGSLTPIQAVSFQFITAEVLRNIAFFVLSPFYQTNMNNKAFYKAEKALVLLQRSSSFGCLSDILYLAMYFYRTKRYERSLSCLQKVQQRMSVPYIIYFDCDNQDLFEHYMAGMSLCNKMRRAVMKEILLYFWFSYMDELHLEQITCIKNLMPLVAIPPFVMLHMLAILNHQKLGDKVRSHQFIHNLQTSLLNDDEFNIPAHIRDISWQILGICQEKCGDVLESKQSYQYSLQQKPFHRIQEATLLRMNQVIN